MVGVCGALFCIRGRAASYTYCVWLCVACVACVAFVALYGLVSLAWLVLLFVSFLAGGLRPIPGVTHSREGSVPITPFFEIEWSWAGRGRARGKFCGAWQVLRVAQSCETLSAAALGGVRFLWAGAAARGCGWLRACGRRGPARVGAAGVGGDDQRARPDRVQGEPAPPAAGRRHQMVILWSAEVGEAGLHVPLGDVADVQVLCGGRVRPVGARAGAAVAHVQCLGLWFVRTVLCVHCNALVVLVCCVGSAGAEGRTVGDGRAQHAVAVRARRSRAALGAAQSAAPLGSLLLQKVLFSRGGTTASERYQLSWTYTCSSVRRRAGRR